MPDLDVPDLDIWDTAMPIFVAPDLESRTSIKVTKVGAHMGDPVVGVLTSAYRAMRGVP